MANIVTGGTIIYLILELIEAFILILIVRRFNIDLKEDKFKKVILILAIAIFSLSFFGSIYSNSQTEHVVLTTLFGTKKVVEREGVHFSLLSSREKVDLRKQAMTYPEMRPETATDGDKLITKDDKIMRLSAILEYQIMDSNKYAILNKDTELKMYIALSSQINKNVRSRTYDEIITHWADIEMEIGNHMTTITEDYGVKILNFYFVKPSDTAGVITSKEQALESKILSEATIQASINEADALKRKFDALEDKEFIKYMELMKAIKEGKVNTIVLSQDANGNILIQNPENQVKKNE